MTPAIAALVFGGILLVAGFQGRNVVDVALGRSGKIPNSTVDEARAAAAIDTGTYPSLSQTPQTGSARGVDAVVAECNRIDSLRSPYQLGGGHAGYTPNGRWDCSGAVSQVLHVAGLLSGPPRVSGAFMLYGSPGPGKRLTVYANLGHVFIEVDGRQWGTSHQNPGGGPGWLDHKNPTSGYAVRHKQGT